MAAALALVLSVPLQAGVEVTATGDRLDVTAAHAPVSEVLDGLARKTRMKVVYEGPAPRTPVTIELRGRTPAQAVLGVLEGLGLNYALVLDMSGTEVETLMIVGTGALTASAGTVRPARGIRRDTPSAIPDEPTADSEEVSEVEGSISAISTDAPKVDENATPGPAGVGPLNPAGTFPNGLPFAPGLPLVMPSPSPNPPSTH